MLKKISATKVLHFTIAVVVALVLAAAVVVGGRVIAPELFSRQQVTINEATFSVEIADTEIERFLGLSAHTSLSERKGMWFVFERAGEYGFVMRDMDFPIDIIWVDADRQVIGAAERAQPDSYPGTVFRPPGPVRYVLEVPAGSVDKYNIEPGQTVKGPN